MSTDWSYRCKQCKGESPGWSIEPEALEEFKKVFNAVKDIDMQWCSIEVIGGGIVFEMQSFLEDHIGHELELMTSYGETYQQYCGEEQV